MRDATTRRLCAALAELLSYPGPGLALAAQRAAALAAGSPAEEGLRRFAARAREDDLARLQELYTSTFDLQPASAPYLGHQLLGDTPLRGPFLARLAEVYARDGHRVREELPDHVAEVLGYLAVAPSHAEAEDLLRDGLLPAAGRMATELPAENPWRDVLLALPRALGEGGGAAASPEQRGAEASP